MILGTEVASGLVYIVVRDVWNFLSKKFFEDSKDKKLKELEGHVKDIKEDMKDIRG